MILSIIIFSNFVKINEFCSYENLNYVDCRSQVMHIFYYNHKANHLFVKPSKLYDDELCSELHDILC